MATHKDTSFRVRCSESKKQKYKRKAQRLGLSLSAFVRRSLDEIELPTPTVSESQHREAAQQQMTVLELARLEAERSGNAKLKVLIRKALKMTAQLTQ